MIGFIQQGGFIMYFLLAVAVAAGGYTISAARGLRTVQRPDSRLEATIDGVMFWGGFGVMLGLLGTLIGIVQAARAIEAAGGTVAPILVWGGIRVALSTLILSLLVFGLASLAWFVLRRLYVSRAAQLS